MSRVETMRALLARVEGADGPDRRLDYEIFTAFAEPGAANAWDPIAGHFYTASVDAALALVERVLPGFWASSGLCSLTGHASIGPDYNGPAGERLRTEWPEADFHAGFDADLKPGDGRHRQCYAILSCVLQALLAQLEGSPVVPDDAPAQATVTIPAADYRRLLEASESDDEIVRCETCGAWLTRDEAASVEDFTGCWKAALMDGNESTCRSYRATVLEGLALLQPDEATDG